MRSTVFVYALPKHQTNLPKMSEKAAELFCSIVYHTRDTYIDGEPSINDLL